MIKERKKQLIKVLISIAIAVLISSILIYWMDIKKLIKVMKDVHLSPILLACLLNIVVMTAKGIRWYYIGSVSFHIGMFQAIRLTILSFFVNSFIPARGGDLLRAIAIAKENKISKATAFASVGIDKLMDILSLLFLAFSLLFIPKLPPWVKKSTLISLIGGYIALILIYLFRKKVQNISMEKAGSKFITTLRNLSMGLEALGKPKIFSTGIFFSIVSYTTQVLMVYLCAASTGIHLSMAEATCSLLVLNIAVSIPLTPTNVGTLHAAFVAIVIFFGFEKEAALTSAIALHISYILPLFVIAPFLGHRSLTVHL